MTWEKVGRNVNREGTTITYRLKGTELIVQSRRRAIPHANGIGTWDHTSYWVMDGGTEIMEKWRLSEAKALAEAIAEEQRLRKEGG